MRTLADCSSRSVSVRGRRRRFQGTSTRAGPRSERKVDDLSRQLADLRQRSVGASTEREVSSAAPVAADALAQRGELEPRASRHDRVRVIDVLGPPTTLRGARDSPARTLMYAMEIGSASFLSGNVEFKDGRVVTVNVPVLASGVGRRSRAARIRMHRMLVYARRGPHRGPPMVELSSFPITRKWPPSRRIGYSSTAERAEWSQGLDHARGDRAAVRHTSCASPRTTRNPPSSSLNPYGRSPRSSTRTVRRTEPLPLFG
jgi:hypothetical protein